MYRLDLSANVQRYQQEEDDWCGEACAQMTRNGYPTAAGPRYYPQAAFYNKIQAANGANTGPDKVWATTPHGMRGCLQSDSEAPVNWVEHVNPNRNEVISFIVFGMYSKGFPTPVIVDEGGHWVVVVGWKTDVEPLAGSTPKLRSIHYLDPSNTDGGSSHTMMPASRWFSQHWDEPIAVPGTWKGEYVAIGQGPDPTYEVNMMPESPDKGKTTTESRHVLTAEEAKKRATGSIEELQLAEEPGYGLLSDRNLEISEPLLTTDKPHRESPETPQFYIVPFGIKNERTESGAPLVRLCILIDAYTGEFEEMTAFDKPVVYLTNQQAVNVVAAALNVAPAELHDAVVTLMFQSSEISHVRAYPFWRVIVKDRSYYVDQKGKLYGSLYRGRPGN